MELVRWTPKAAKFEYPDVISTMPDNVISNILDRLPTEEAVRTDVLSRKWRFKWTLLTQLVFDDKFFISLVPDDKIHYNRGNLSKILLNLVGPIRKFVLSLHDKILDVKDISHWILFLSRREIQELTLINKAEVPLQLPTQIFSCMELKHLKLRNWIVRHSSEFNGFPKLLSLDLSFVVFQSWTFGELIARCPLLEILKITTNKVELSEIARLRNLKILSMPLGALNKVTMLTSSNIFQLKRLRKLQELTLDFRLCKWEEAGGNMKVPPGAFVYLKTLTLSQVDFSDDVMVSFVCEMVRGCQNLQTLKIRANTDVQPSALCSLEIDPNTMMQLKLRNVVFTSFMGSENEVCLIKFILACSPQLKNISIKYHPSETGLMLSWELAKKLLKLPRASPIAEIDFY